MKKRILITGSNGMLGVDLWQELEGHYEVYGIDLSMGQGPGAKGHGQRFLKRDIADKRSVFDAISKIEPDVVIHTAAWTDVDGCELDKGRAYAVNSNGTDNVAVACRKIGATLIYISTDFVFNGRKEKPYKETDRPDPLSVYGDSKLKGEASVRRNLKRYFIIRTSWLYGRHGRNFVDTILAKAKTEKELRVVDDQVGSPTYTKDLAKALHALADKVTSRKSQVTSKEYGIYHITNSGNVSWYEYARRILRLAGSKTKVVPISSAQLNRPARRPAMSVLDNSKFKRFTGCRMRGWQNTLKAYLKEKERG